MSAQGKHKRWKKTRFFPHFGFAHTASSGQRPIHNGAQPP